MFKGTTIAVRVKDTIKLSDNNKIVQNTFDRSKLWQIQTPQCFDKDVLLFGHKKCIKENIDITDDCIALELINEKIKIIEGDYSNIKITTPEDLLLAQLIL